MYVSKRFCIHSAVCLHLKIFWYSFSCLFTFQNVLISICVILRHDITNLKKGLAKPKEWTLMTRVFTRGQKMELLGAIYSNR